MSNPRPPASVERLATELLEPGVDDPLRDELAAWLALSNRFRAWAVTHRAKIRKKLRGAADQEARRDLRVELLVARLLLADRRFEVAFEAYGAGKAGPDLTVTLRGQRTFNLEITRIRRPPDTAALVDPVLAKLRQLPPAAPNALLIAHDGLTATTTAASVSEAARALRARADRKDEAWFAARGHAGTRAFYDRFLRLGAVFLLCEAAGGAERATVWANPSARIALPDRAVRACLVALRGA